MPGRVERTAVVATGTWISTALQAAFTVGDEPGARRARRDIGDAVEPAGDAEVMRR